VGGLEVALEGPVCDSPGEVEPLEGHGEVHRVGDRWSTGPSVDAVVLAIDRLQAPTSNLRTVRDRARVS